MYSQIKRQSASVPCCVGGRLSNRPLPGWVFTRVENKPSPLGMACGFMSRDMKQKTIVPVQSQETARPRLKVVIKLPGSTRRVERDVPVPSDVVKMSEVVATFPRVSVGEVKVRLPASLEGGFRLPTLAPGIGTFVGSPLRFPQGDNKLVDHINKGFSGDRRLAPFAAILQRFRIKGQAVLKRRTGRFTNSNKRSVFSLALRNGFDCLEDEPLNEDGSPYCVAATPRRVRKLPRRVSNTRFAEWCDRNLACKKEFYLLEQNRREQKVLRSSGRACLTLPSSTHGIEAIFRSHIGSHVSTKRMFLRVLSAIQSSYNCPAKPFTIIREQARWRVYEGGSSNGLHILDNGKTIAHFGDEVPYSPTSSISSRAEEFNRRLSCLSPVTDASRLWGSDEQNAFIKENQEIIDLSSSLRTSRYWEPDEVVEKIWSILSVSPLKMNATLCFFVALTWKQRYNCPTNSIHINFNRVRRRVEKMTITGEEISGRLMFYVDNKPLYHCGIEAGKEEHLKLKRRALMWKAAFLTLGARDKLRDYTSKAISLSTGASTISVSEPGFDKYLLGFTICAGLSGVNIYSRGLDFTRPDTRPGQDGMISTRQRRLFWDLGGKELVFTYKGLAKIFWRKREGERWRNYIAKAIGLTLNAAIRYFSGFLNDNNTPDVVFRELSEDLVPPRQIVKEKLVYVEVPVEVLTPRTSTESVVTEQTKEQEEVTVPPPPPMPTKPRVKVHQKPKSQLIVNGDDWLVAPGNEGKSRRALFRDTFKADWERRVSDAALRLMNQDASRYPDYKSRSFSEGELIVDPKQSFDLNATRYSSPVVERNVHVRSNSAPDMSKMADEFKERRSKLNVTQTRVSGGVRLGRVIQPNIARNSSDADIELNPGPEYSDDKLLFQHPSPGEYDMMKTHGHARSVSLPVVDGDSPLDGLKFSLTEDTLSREQANLLIRNLHISNRDSTMADIEENPGPTKDREVSPGPSRGRAPAREPTKTIDHLDPRTERSRSRVRSLIGKLGLDFGNDHDKFRDAFGKPDTFEVQTRRSNGFLKQYEHCILVGHLPANRNWHSDDPIRWWSAVGFQQLQRSLDELNVSKIHFTRVKLPDVLSSLNTFFQTLEGTTISGSVISALAHYVKSSINCPNDSFGYALNIEPAEKQVFLHYTERPSPETHNRLWWCMNGFEMIHGGVFSDTISEEFPQPSAQYHFLNQNYQWSRMFLPTSYLPNPRIVRFHDTVIEHHGWQPHLLLSSVGADSNHMREFRRDILSIEPPNTKFKLEDFETLQVLVMNYFRKNFGEGEGQTTCTDTFLRGMLKSIRRWRSCPDFDNSCAIHFDFYKNELTFHWGLKNNKFVGLWFMSQTDPFAHLGEENTDAVFISPFRSAHRIAYKRATELERKYGPDVIQVTAKDDPTYAEWYEEEYGHSSQATIEIRLNIVWSLLYVYSFLCCLFSAYEPYFRPSLSNARCVTKSDSDYHTSTKPEESLLVCTLGTRGDQVPAEYFGNLAGHFGIPAHIRRYHDMTTQDLEGLKLGDMFTTLPGYLDLHYAANLGYKRIFTPHLEVDTSRGMSYSLSPSNKWIESVSFVTDWSKVKLTNILPALLATRLNAVFSPTWRIGSLRDSDLPRSHDGFNLLERRKQTKKNKIGWTSGSGDVSLIPEAIRQNFEEVPRGNHLEIFRDYKTIHMHGGAGTVQTAIACGAEPVVHDPTLDRNYKRLPTAKDFKQSSVGPFMGWLLWSGFKPDAPFEVKMIWTLQYLWSTKFTQLYELTYASVKLYTILVSLCAHWLLFVLIFFSISLTVWRALFKETSIVRLVQMMFKVFWDFPILCLLQSQLGVIIFLWSLKSSWMKLSQDFTNSKHKSTQLVFEPVSRGRVEFPFPFGHWALRDNNTSEVFEGKFTENPQTVGSKFKLCSSIRELKPGAKVFPSPFSIAKARVMIETGIERPYSSVHNCATLALELVSARSLLWTLTLGVFTGMIFIALSPPEILKKVLDFLFPGMGIEETPFYSRLGFAAGIEGIPFEHEEDVEHGIHFKSPAIEIKEPNWAEPQSFEMLIDEISVIQTEISRLGLESLDQSDLEEVSQRVLDKELERVPTMENKMLEIIELPPYVKHTWADIVDGIHHSMSVIRSNRIVDCFIAWLRTIETNAFEFMFPILELASYFLSVCWDHSKEAFKKLFINVCHLMDHVWGLEASKRVKTAWGLTGLHRTGLLGVKARLAANIAYSEFIGRTDFESDYNRFVQNGKAMARKYGATHLKNLGGEQRRPVGYSKPLMSQEEAKLLGFKEDEYVTNSQYEERIRSYLEQGVHQGADGVFLADKMPELIAKSQHRYEPKYPELCSEERAFAREIAQAMFDKYPSVFADADVLPPRAVHNYIKAKYSPGTPFIKPGGFKSRQAMFDAGYDKVMQRNALKMLETGRYPVQFYHAFVKSQVVDIKKCLPRELGGKDKDVRTVVSQDLWSYYIDQCLQIERNKRINWDVYGAGIGMPLNQSMQTIYNRMSEKQKERGGRYIIADATAFDSFCKPFLFEVNACLWELGFKDHPSGNGANMASVLRASYKARTQGGSWIIGVTEPEYKNLVVSVPDPALRSKIRSQNPISTVDLSELVPDSRGMSSAQFNSLVKELLLPENVTVLSWSSNLRPKRANWMGEYVVGDTKEVSSKFFANQTLTYDPGNEESLLADVKALSRSNYKLMSNVHAKNRGGSTGGSDTSNVNTHAFKAGVIYAWCMTTGRPPKEFFEYNDIANTSDDTIWQSGGKYGLNTVDDVHTFARYCAEVGIHLEIETTKDISKVEYLSKFVRVPTKEDSEALKAWRSSKISAINHSNRQKGYDGVSEEQLSKLNNPRFVVVQNPSAILLRRSAFRYYQASPSKWRYTSIERGAGHANNTAFVPQLYASFAKEWCDDVNSVMREHNIHRRFELKVGKFGLHEVMQIDTRASQQSLSPRQKALIQWLKGNMFPSYYRVLDIHMNVAKIDPEQHSRFLKKLEKGWRGWNEIINEGVDTLFDLTGAIPDEWSKKFQPGVEMLYAERPFYTRNKYVEKFVYLKLLEESTEETITFSDFSSRVQESPYGAVCDIYHFWESLQNRDFKDQLMLEEVHQIQGMVMAISALYMLTSMFESILMSIPIVGALYKLFLWNFIGLNKVYGITNTMYWHSTGRSSRELSRIMPRDPYMVSKQFCAFVVDLLPFFIGWLFLLPVHLLSLLPPCLDAIGKTWFVAGEVKQVVSSTQLPENPWDKYPEQYVEALRKSPTGFAYIAAKTATGKSSWWVSALWARKNPLRIRKIWVMSPRKVLRDEAKIPFGIKVQKLMKGVQLDNTTDVYFMTYGHAQSRLIEMDPENDICLFDEFHEESGEMILALSTIKCKSFLLSATPVEIPMLKGSPYLAPNIDQRFPTTIIKVDDSMSIPDMFLEAQNRYPEQCKRALIIVPTHKMCEKVLNSLNYLKVGKVSILSARQREVPREGIIIATPYVQTGLDITPQCKILIDSGKDLVIDKGRLMTTRSKGRVEYPWTHDDVNKQRIGRVGRLEAGIVFQPRSAGTGKKPVSYPSPHMFMHESIAKHFGIEGLIPQSGAVSSDLPFMSLNGTRLPTNQIRKSVTIVHTLALSGIRQNEWEAYYTKLMQKQTLGDDFYLLDKVASLSKWYNVPLLSYEQALYHTNRANTVRYAFESGKRWSRPLQAINGKWIQYDISPSHNVDIQELPSIDVESRYEKLQGQLNHYRSCLLRHARESGSDNFVKAVHMLKV